MLPTAGFWMALFWAVIVVLVLAGFAQARRRLRDQVEGPGLDDDAIRAIEETGFLATGGDAPLALDEIEEEERRFWEEETWDEAEEW
jgi:hypothetical protein